MCTKLNNVNKKANHNNVGMNRTEIDFSLIDVLSGINVSDAEIAKQFPNLIEFSHNTSRVELTDEQMAIIQGHYETEKKIPKVNLSKISEFPVIRIKPQSNGRDEAGYIYIRFFRKNANTILGAIYSALPFCGPMYVEEFYVCGLSKPKIVYVNSSLRNNPDFLEDIQGELRICCISVLSFVETYTEFCCKKSEKSGKEKYCVTAIRPFKYTNGYTRKERHVCGYFKRESA